MALEAVVYPQDPFTYGCKDLYSLVAGGGANWSHREYGFQVEAEEEKALLGIINNNIEQSLHANLDSSSPDPSVLQNVKDHREFNSSSPETCTVDQSLCAPDFPASSAADTGRRKRRRTKSAKNKEEIENQRMTHIAVERNRRKQMNEYLAVLRSLMPPSYVQRGDQASIVGGAINFVKELEQLLQSIEGERQTKQQKSQQENGFTTTSPFADFFTFPQYTTSATTQTNTTSCTAMNESMEQKQCAVADIEVTMVESHANLKILSKKRPGLLMKMVVGLQSLRLCILHLNVTTVHHLVLYSLSVKVEEGCQLNTVDEIAAAVNQLLCRIQEEAAFS